MQVSQPRGRGRCSGDFGPAETCRLEYLPEAMLLCAGNAAHEDAPDTFAQLFLSAVFIANFPIAGRTRSTQPTVGSGDERKAAD
jgi:hypothetical protein